MFKYNAHLNRSLKTSHLNKLQINIHPYKKKHNSRLCTTRPRTVKSDNRYGAIATNDHHFQHPPPSSTIFHARRTRLCAPKSAKWPPRSSHGPERIRRGLTHSSHAPLRVTCAYLRATKSCVCVFRRGDVQLKWHCCQPD